MRARGFATARALLPTVLPMLLAGALLAGSLAAGSLRLDLAHMLAGGVVIVLALAARRQAAPALLVGLLLLPLAWHFAVRLPAAERALTEPGLAARGYLRLEGTVRAREAVPNARAGDGAAQAGQPGRVRLLLGRVLLWPHPGAGLPSTGLQSAAPLALAELEVELPARSEWTFAYRSRLRLGGRLQPGGRGAVWAQGRLRLAFAEAEHYRRVAGLPALLAPLLGPVLGPRAQGADALAGLRLHLRDRAAYYLSRPALGTYLPLVLGRRERDTPEARAVTGAFRRVGVAHLFAISGLHVSLLYGLFLLAQHVGLGAIGALHGLRGGQGWAHSPGARRVVAAVAVWLYIALIGFPIPAVRAALMGTLLVWSEGWGTRSPPVYVLLLAALLLLLPDASQLYDISFQLSFLAYFFLLRALTLHRRSVERRDDPVWSRWRTRWSGAARLNLWMTLVITLGLWPVAAATFGTVSLLVFAGNLVLIPLLGVLVLPLGLVALGTSLLHAGAAPGGLLERAAFGALDAVLHGWIAIVAGLDTLSGTLVLPVTLQWGAGAFVAYYAGLLGLLWLPGRARRRRRHSGAESGTGPRGAPRQPAPEADAP